MSLGDNKDSNTADERFSALYEVSVQTYSKSTPWQQPGANVIHVSLSETEHTAVAWS